MSSAIDPDDVPGKAWDEDPLKYLIRQARANQPIWIMGKIYAPVPTHEPRPIPRVLVELVNDG